MRRWGQRSPGRLGTKGGRDCPTCRLAGRGTVGHPQSEAQGEPTRTSGHPRPSLINRAGREPGPRQLSPGHRLPWGPGLHALPEPSSTWARRPSIVSGGLSLVTQAWPAVRGGGVCVCVCVCVCLLMASCPCQFTVTVPPLNTREAWPESHRPWRGGQTQDSAQTHSSVVCEFFSVPPSRTSIPTARCCPALPPEAINPATFLPSSPPSPPWFRSSDLL